MTRKTTEILTSAERCAGFQAIGGVCEYLYLSFPNLNTLPYEKIILRFSIDGITVCFCRLRR